MHEDCYIQIRHLENLVDEQARVVQRLRARGPLGWFQRKRLGKANELAVTRVALTEDSLRNENNDLKWRIRELEAELGSTRKTS